MKKRLSSDDIDRMKNQAFSFSHDKLDYDIHKCFPFVKNIIYNNNTYVDLRYCCGTDHGSYFRQSHHSLINSMNRMDHNLYCLSHSANYYFSHEKKDHMSYAHIDNKYYIIMGNHRTIIAKHLFAYLKVKPHLYGVEVYEHEIDKKRMYYFYALRKILKKFYGGKWKSHIKSNIHRADYSENCHFNIVILPTDLYITYFLNHPFVKIPKTVETKTNEYGWLKPYVNGFCFDDDNINILYEFIDCKIHKKEMNFYSPSAVIDGVLSGILKRRSAYGYRALAIWNNRESRVSQKSPTYLDSTCYLYLTHHTPFYRLHQHVILLLKMKINSGPLPMIYNFIGYCLKIQKTKRNLSWRSSSLNS